MIRGLETHVNWSLAREAYENAERLLTGARLASAIRNHGLAVSLAVLGKEEAQKSLLLGFVSSGLYSLEDKDVRTELKECFLHHMYKIAGSWLVEAFVAYFFTFLEEQMEKIDAPKETVSSFRKNVVEKNIERVKRRSEISQWNLDALKKRGLYVGPIEGVWSLPTEITNAECEEVMKDAEFHVNLVHGTNWLLSRANIPEESKDAAREFRKILKKKPTDSERLAELRKTGQLGTMLAGFWEFLVKNNLISLEKKK